MVTWLSKMSVKQERNCRFGHVHYSTDRRECRVKWIVHKKSSGKH